jgi:hypothetical protein
MKKHNVIYLLGAGASAQKWIEIDNIKYPEIPEIPLADTFDKTIDYHLLYMFHDLFYTKTEFNDNYKNKLIGFSAFISKHNTIDEAMRKLYLNNETAVFNEYKNLIDLVFFLLESVRCNYDSRYAQFLLTLVNNKFQLPDNIKILSWNYDNQFEHAESDISYGNKGITLNTNNFHKINGSAKLYNKSDLLFMKRDCDDFENEKHVIGNNVTKLVHKTHSDIDFAWEESQPTSSKIHHSTRLTDFLNKCPKEDNVMVVIGYSFPYVNHEYDLQIINELNINKIYYQSKVDITNVLKDRFVSNGGVHKDFIFIADCDRFYLPNELFSNPSYGSKTYNEEITLNTEANNH